MTKEKYACKVTFYRLFPKKKIIKTVYGLYEELEKILAERPACDTLITEWITMNTYKKHIES